MIEPREFRTALGRFPTGVAIVTAAVAGERIGMTVNSFVSVSLDPPLVQFSINRRAHSFERWCAADHFAVNILSEGQVELSNRFARPLTEKWEGLDIAAGLGGAPLLPGVLCTLECSRWADYDGGDHVIFLGEVGRLTMADGERPPLVFHGGGYRRLAEETGKLVSAEDDLLPHGW